MHIRQLFIAAIMICATMQMEAGKGKGTNKSKRNSLRSSQEKEAPTLTAEFYRKLKNKQKKSGLTKDEALLMAFIESVYQEMGSDLRPNPTYDLPPSDSEDEAQQ